MISKVENWCLRHGLLHKGQKILVACSGGPDSLALLDVLCRLKGKYALEVAAAHLNHMIRGSDADEDAAFVGAFCQARKLQCYQSRCDVPAYAAVHRLSLEESARILRYEFLRSSAQRMGGAKIAVAHHQGDQAETVLLHLLRGAGSGGLGGMKPESRDVIRPFLGVSRQEIEAYCQARNLKPRHDRTNEETQYLRNRIRLLVLPELERLVNPGVQMALCRSAELVGAEHDFIRQTALGHFEELVLCRSRGVFIQKHALNLLHIALRREILRLAIEKISGQFKGISFLHIEKMLELAQHGVVGSYLELPGRLYFVCGYDQMKLSLCRPEPAVAGDLSEYELKLDGVTDTPRFVINTMLEKQDGAEAEMNEMLFDYEHIKPPLFLRFRRQGDVFQPLGMRGTKKLKDFLIDMKLPREQRDRIPLICDSEKIIWIVGIRQGEQARVSKATKLFLRINIRVKDE